MYRDEPHNDLDSGWHFASDRETQEYLDDPNNSGIYHVNTIANCDNAIIPYLRLPIVLNLNGCTERTSLT